MTHTAVFIVGAPAAGKTTLARKLLGPLDRCTLIEKPKWTLSFDHVCAAGHYTGDTFDGADRVGYNQVKPTLGYWQRELAGKARLTIFDGDRFSFESAIDFVAQFCSRVCCVYVLSEPAVLEARRAERGWAPNPRWLKGRQTKARYFMGLFRERDRLFAGTAGVDEVTLNRFLVGAR